MPSAFNLYAQKLVAIAWSSRKLNYVLPITHVTQGFRHNILIYLEILSSPSYTAANFLLFSLRPRFFKNKVATAIVVTLSRYLGPPWPWNWGSIGCMCLYNHQRLKQNCNHEYNSNLKHWMQPQAVKAPRSQIGLIN